MCGITASYNASTEVNQDSTTLAEQLQSSISALNHRGPDSSGIYISDDGRLGLGHARLSIIDVEGGTQPLHDLEGHVHAVVNGELYDYAELRQDLEKRGRIFQTFSDSELVVHLYKVHGVNLVQYLRGEFAFIIYDSQRKVLFAARDRFGIKPLYYTLSNGRLLIASEMKALQATGWKPEWDVQSIIEGGEFNDNRTLFKGVFKLPAAHHLIFTRMGQLKIQPYWDQSYPNSQIAETRSVEEIIQGVREHMVDAVRVRLRSDVPLAVALSGGLDSSAVAGIASTLLKEKDPAAKVITFTLAFPERGDLDEGPIAQRMAEMIGAECHMVQPSEIDLVSVLEKAVYHTEQPVHTMHPSGKLILSEYIRAKGYKVVLTGEGSDEVQAGYSFLPLDFLRAGDPSASLLGIPLPSPTELPYILEERLNMRPPQEHTAIGDFSLTHHSLGRSMLGDIILPQLWSAMSPPPKIIHPRALREFGGVDHTVIIAEALRPEARAKLASKTWHPLHAALYTTASVVLPWLLNQVGDRTELANSVEGRQPFLDHKLVEYMNTVPPSLKILPQKTHDGEWILTEKWVLRQAVKPYITEEIYLRRKAQYNAPLPAPKRNGDATGIKNNLTPLQVFLKERVTKDRVNALGFLNWDNINTMLEDYILSPDCPADGGLDKRARVLLSVASYTILQDKFKVPTAVF
ncbi:putative asparagine synthase [Phlegmacium glaucopus]|nr:putative asparagine synthase [Phlegmacium glaucopus]